VGDVAWVFQSHASHSEAATAPPLSFIEARLDYLAQHMQQKLMGFLNSRR
jgi:hypothetical protein